MRKFIFISILMAGTIAISCTKKASPAKSSDAAAMPAKAPAVTYTASVKSLIQAKCAPCHVTGGRKALLDNYEGAKKYVDDIVARVQLAPTERGFMPFRSTTPLSADEIALLKKWRDGGLAE